MRQSLGTAVVWGMVGVTFFGLIFTPAFYVFMRWVASKLPGAKKTAAHEPQPPAATTAPISGQGEIV
jgi:hypothetical protein